MKRAISTAGLVVLLAASLAMGRGKKDPLTGTWECQAHGSAQGDMAFTLYLLQNKELVDGRISSPIGGTEISSGTFAKNKLEIHIDTPQGNYILLAKYNKGALSGNWSNDTEKGAWEGKKKTDSVN
jgi:hypothetical protein